MPRLSDLLRDGVIALQKADIAGAAQDARALLAHAAGIAPDRLTLNLNGTAADHVIENFSRLIGERLHHRPVAQIIGKRLFWGRSFVVTRDTLDPRPETEILVAEALRLPFTSVLDMGTGTGCILLSLLAERPAAMGQGSDISPAALAVATKNAATLGLSLRAEFVQSDWFSTISRSFDLIVSNPPYIDAGEMAQLSRDVRDWEPHLALTPGGDGLDAYRAISAGAAARLVAGGRILLEIGPTQGAAVCTMLASQGFTYIHILKDFDGRDRVVCAVNSTK